MVTYTPAQLTQYLAHISHPLPSPTIPRSLALLSSLLTRQICTIPFESLSLHYSTIRLLSLSPSSLFEKFISEPNRSRRGGYCMENNTFFACVLRSLGFSVLSVGARVSHETTGRHDGGWEGWSHMVNLVRVDGQRYLVDAGFGSNGSCRPIALRKDKEGGEVCEGVGPQQCRLEFTCLTRHTDPEQRVWVYSHRETERESWTEAYCFTETEFFAEDFEVMNLWTMTRRESFFVQNVIAQRFVLEQELEGDGEPLSRGMGTGDEEDGPKAVGVMILYGNLAKRRIGNQVQVLAVLESEADRMAALQNYFGIRLSEEEQRGIRDLPTELRGNGGGGGESGHIIQGKVEAPTDPTNGFVVLERDGANIKDTN